jgi:hypothetical protein
MRKINHLTLSAALLVLAAGVSFAGTAIAQPHPPAPPGVFMPGDLHVRIVPEGRPALRHEVRIARPGPNHVWQAGYWHHTGSAWNWTEGVWAVPPQSHSRWIAPRYEKVQGGTRYHPAHWSHEHLIID